MDWTDAMNAMNDDDDKVLSIFLDTPTAWDKLFRKVKDYTYVVEYQWLADAAYHTHIKRYQRRYADIHSAMRRFDYLLVKHDVEKAYILKMPIDTAHYKRKATEAHAQCTRCGGHEFVWDGRE